MLVATRSTATYASSRSDRWAPTLRRGTSRRATGTVAVDTATHTDGAGVVTTMPPTEVDLRCNPAGSTITAWAGMYQFPSGVACRTNTAVPPLRAHREGRDDGDDQRRGSAGLRQRQHLRGEHRRREPASAARLFRRRTGRLPLSGGLQLDAVARRPAVLPGLTLRLSGGAPRRHRRGTASAAPFVSESRSSSAPMRSTSATSASACSIVAARADEAGPQRELAVRPASCSACCGSRASAADAAAGSARRGRRRAGET